MTDTSLSLSHPRAYLAGCLAGNAWISKGSKASPYGYFGLNVADKDFAEAFAAAIFAGFGVHAKPIEDKRGYWTVRKNNGWNRFEPLRHFQPDDDDQRSAWLRGFFDSQGSVVCVRKQKAGPRSWDRRVIFISTDLALLESTVQMLAQLGIVAMLRNWSCGTGHLGSKKVMAAVLQTSRSNYELFLSAVGSNIKRKLDLLSLIPTTYQLTPSRTYASAKAKGAAIRRVCRDFGGPH